MSNTAWVVIGIVVCGGLLIYVFSLFGGKEKKSYDLEPEMPPRKEPAPIEPKATLVEGGGLRVVTKRDEKGQMVAFITGDGDYELDIVGESHYQEELSAICGGHVDGGHNHECHAVLILDDENAHDSNAVCVGIDGKMVGHLDADDAPIFRQRVREAGVDRHLLVAKAKIVGGFFKSDGSPAFFGVKLDVPWPEIEDETEEDED